MKKTFLNMKYIIKISPEISVKSKPVRKKTIILLKNNIKIYIPDKSQI